MSRIKTKFIVDNAVTNPKLAQMPTHTIKGNATGGLANAADLTGTETTALLDNFVGDSGSGGTKGLVPAPGAGDALKFLRGDGTWVTVGSPTPQTTALANNQASPADIYTMAFLGAENQIVDYSIIRGTTKETGTITITTNGTLVGIATANVDLGVAAGITFTADISGANIRLRYTSTNTTTGSMKWTLRSWAD
jgi:hypothetical protein